MVRMWPCIVALMRSIIAASVVDLPLPVGPVTRTRPRGFAASVLQISGSPRSSNEGIFAGMLRSTIEMEPRWRMMFTRKRATPETEYEQSKSPRSSNVFH